MDTTPCAIAARRRTSRALDNVHLVLVLIKEIGDIVIFAFNIVVWTFGLPAVGGGKLCELYVDFLREVLLVVLVFNLPFSLLSRRRAIIRRA